MNRCAILAVGILALAGLIACGDSSQQPDIEATVEARVASRLATPVPTAAPGAPAPAPAPIAPAAESAPPAGRIAFTSERDGNGEIYMMNADGSGITRLTNHEADDWTPRWSPDGRYIVFESERDDGDLEIYRMRPDGSDVTRLTNSEGADVRPSWTIP